jgi:hypothetical protein
LAIYLVLVHGLGLAVLLPLPVPGWVQLLAALLVLAGLVYNLLHHLQRRLPWSIREAWWDEQDIWTLTLASGRQVEARLLPDSLVTVSLLVLNFRLGSWRRASLVLPGDSLPPDLQRRLRVRLRLTYRRVPNAPKEAETF